MAEEFVWVQNPEGRKVEVAQSEVKELLERGFKLSDSAGIIQQEGEQKEFLEVIEI